MGCFHVVYISCVGSCECRVLHVVAVARLIGSLFFVLCGALSGAWFLYFVACVFCVAVRFLSSLVLSCKRLPESCMLLFAVVAPSVVWCALCLLFYSV